MGLLRSLLLLVFFLLLSSLLSSILTNCLPSVHHPTHHECHEDESYALLQFKESFVISESASVSPSSYPKTMSWMASTDCCSSWDGIECDELQGHVIAINLGSSQLYGSIHANSTLFQLLQVQSLNLSDNHFNNSHIPSNIGQLSKLRYLDLSHPSQTTFSGEIPPQISHLPNLLSLDLSSYSNRGGSRVQANRLHLKISTFRTLIQNSTRLEVLSLSHVNISSLPHTLTNLTHLQKLSLIQCELYGEFPLEMFLKFKMLTSLGLSHNKLSLLARKSSSNVTLPPIRVLRLGSCNISGEIQSWTMNLTNLAVLDLRDNYLIGEIPHSLVPLENLETLILRNNLLQGQLELDKFLELNILTHLDLSNNNLSLLTGKGSPNVTRHPMVALYLDHCNLSGKIPTWILNLTTLHYLSLQDNYLEGEIPHSLFRLENLESLSLTENFFKGRLQLDMFLKFKMLNFLSLSVNDNLYLLTGKVPSNETLPPLQLLGLDSCNFVEPIPNWIWRMRSLKVLSVSQSSLTGELSPLICNLKSLVVLDLSYNNLSGMIPSCLASFSQSLQFLSLQGNRLVGSIPEKFMIGSSLKMVNFSDNNLQGQLPRALVNCKMLEFLDVSYNQINDSFPFWLGTLPELKVIALRHNEFHGAIICTKRCTFPNLHIIDLSHNKFSGNLSSGIFNTWKSMIVSNKSQLKYQNNYMEFDGNSFLWYDVIPYGFTISNKAIDLHYMSLQQFYDMVAIDLSSNNFSGEIPNIIGDLKNLILLNLSNNMLSGFIPSSLGKLWKLESLDLSLNSLSGKIPQQLVELTFLESFNVSFNNLSGPIPENNQFSTFPGNSFKGNQGLCGIQLLKKCEDHASTPSLVLDGDQESNSESVFEFDWKVILIGYGGGLVAGLALGNAFSLDVIRWLKRILS